MATILCVVGARPNFMKVAAIQRAFRERDWQGEHGLTSLICHTGQHYDEKMSRIFFDELELPEPDFYLGVGHGTHTEQTAKIMIAFEKVVAKVQPALVLVVGDVNSTLACSLTAAKMGVQVAHVEAGLRSFDRSMPEEINRIITDAISDYLFVSEKSGQENLQREGAPADRTFLVGNVMIDTLIQYLPRASVSPTLRHLGLTNGCAGPLPYVLVTFHRPGNVDRAEWLEEMGASLDGVAQSVRVVFPIHPRTRARLKDAGIWPAPHRNVILTEPLGYLDFLCLLKNATAVLTDSGGIQEETTYLGIPCLTMRKNTERPVTVEIGTNRLIGQDWATARALVANVLAGDRKCGGIPPLWDGRSADRIVDIIGRHLTA